MANKRNYNDLYLYRIVLIDIYKELSPVKNKNNDNNNKNDDDNNNNNDDNNNNNNNI